MKTNIIGVKYEDNIHKKTFGGREYSYFTVIPLQIGDIVKAPTINGVSNALVTSIDIPEEKIISFKDKLKTIVIKLDREIFLSQNKLDTAV